MVGLLVQRVHFLVPRNQGAGGDGVAMHKRIERVLDHGQCQIGHVRQVQRDFDRRLLRQVAGALGDLGGLVADALEVDDDLERRGDEAQIRGHRLPTRENLGNLHGHGHEAEVGGERRLGQQQDGHLVDLHLELVNRVVIRLHAQRQVVVALHEGLNGFVHGFLGVAGHHQQFLAQRFDAGFKMIFHSLNSTVFQPNRPLT